MSYEIVRSIKVRDGKVYLKSSANNVSPRTFREWECTSLSAYLANHGQDALEAEILEQFESGVFQGPIARYNNALAILRKMPEYAQYNWHNGWGKESEQITENRKSPAFRELVKKALNSKLPKNKFIISKPYYEYKPVYLWKITRKAAKWTHDKEKAKVFRYEEDAKAMPKYFTNSDSWTVEQIA